MKLIKKLLGLLLVLGLVLGGITLFTRNSSSEVAGILDQLNPLVKKSELYVKTKAPDSVNEYGTASYQQTAAASDGKTREITFSGLKVLKEDHYLKLTSKGAHVETYEEVTRAEVPEAALEKID